VFRWVLSSAYRFALDPTRGQDAVVRSHCGGQRYAVNWGLALAKATLSSGGPRSPTAFPPFELTPPLNWLAYCLQNYWIRAKDTTAPWWAENSNEAYSSGRANLATALSNWNASRSGKRGGPKVRFPRFKETTRHVVSVHPPACWPGDRLCTRIPNAFSTAEMPERSRLRGSGRFYPDGWSTSLACHR
jgi:hypothetical protein